MWLTMCGLVWRKRDRMMSSHGRKCSQTAIIGMCMWIVSLYTKKYTDLGQALKFVFAVKPSISEIDENPKCAQLVICRIFFLHTPSNQSALSTRAGYIFVTAFSYKYILSDKKTYWEIHEVSFVCFWRQTVYVWVQYHKFPNSAP